MPRSSRPAPAVLQSLSDELIDQIVRLQRVVHRLKQSPPGGSGGDRSAHVLLLMVHHRGPLRVADLAGACFVDASTVSRQAAELVRDGLLRREADPEDGRASLMALTEAGHEHVQAMFARRRTFFSQVVRDWETEDLLAFQAYLRRFVDDVESAYTDAGPPATDPTSTPRQEVLA